LSFEGRTRGNTQRGHPSAGGPAGRRRADPLARIFTVLAFAISLVIALYVHDEIVVGNGFGRFDGFVVGLLCVGLLLLGLTAYLAGTRHRALAANLWLSVAATLLTFFVLDAVLGLALMPPQSPSMIPHAFAHHTLKPGVRETIDTKAFDYELTVNSVGLRGGEILLRRPSNGYRILMLGDSFTLGKGVEDDETFSAILERSLSDGGDRIVEVLNAGVDSHAPLLSYFRLTRELPPLDPDLVILNVDMSDLVQEEAYRAHARRSADGAVVGVPGRYADGETRSLQERIRDLVHDHLFISRLFMYWLGLSSGDDDKGPTVENVVELASFELLAHTLASDSTDRSGQWAGLFESILLIKAYSEENGIRFLVSIYPWGHQVNEREWMPGRFQFVPEGAVVSDESRYRIRQFAQSQGIDLVDAFDAFREYDGEAPLYYSNDAHWTPEGHRLMARVLEPNIRRLYLNNLNNGRMKVTGGVDRRPAGSP